MNLFDFLRGKDWREVWLEEAEKENSPPYYKLDNRTKEEFNSLIKKASEKGLLKLALNLEELKRVRGLYKWE